MAAVAAWSETSIIQGQLIHLEAGLLGPQRYGLRIKCSPSEHIGFFSPFGLIKIMQQLHANVLVTRLVLRY